MTTVRHYLEFKELIEKETFEPLTIANDSLLSKALADLKKPFFVKGSLLGVEWPFNGAPGSCTDFNVDEIQLCIDGKPISSLGQIDPKLLMEYMEQKAKISGDRITFGNRCLTELFGHRLRRRMMDRECWLTFKLDKLHIDQEMGIFQINRGDNHFATVLIALPVKHTGGSVKVNYAGMERIFCSESDDPLDMNWCCFSTDCDYEMLPVTSGVRMVLQYDVFIDLDDIDDNKIVHIYDEQSDSDDEMPCVVQQKRLVDLAQDMVDDEGAVGIILTHHYGVSGLRWSTLRGFDQFLYQVFEPYFSCHLKPLILLESSQPNEQWDLQMCTFDPKTLQYDRNLTHSVVFVSRYVVMDLLSHHIEGDSKEESKYYGALLLLEYKSNKRVKR